jgi:Telomere recombination
MDDAEGADEARPPVVAAGAVAVLEALAAGSIVAVPNIGGYSLAVRAGSPDGEARLVELAADPDGPHYAVGQIEDLRPLTSGWTDELGRLLERCWPGPVEVFVPWAGSGDAGDSGDADDSGDNSPEDQDDGITTPLGAPGDGAPGDGASEYGVWAAVVGMPDGRALRRLCREQGPWRTVPLRFTEPDEVAHAFGVDDVALVVDGGRREGPLPTLVDALPASFIEGTMLMSTRRKLFSRNKRPDAD